MRIKWKFKDIFFKKIHGINISIIIFLEILFLKVSLPNLKQTPAPSLLVAFLLIDPYLHYYPYYERVYCETLAHCTWDIHQRSRCGNLPLSIFSRASFARFLEERVGDSDSSFLSRGKFLCWLVREERSSWYFFFDVLAFTPHGVESFFACWCRRDWGLSF